MNALCVQEDRAERARGICAPFREEYPFEPHFLETPSGAVHYLDEGRPEDAPILCVHGNPTWSFYFRRIARDFRDRCRVIVPDHLGCGLSDKPQDWSFRLADHVANLERLVLELDLREITLVVHDWGGAIGCGVAVRHPERFSRILVTNTAAFPAKRIPLRINVCRTPLLGALAVRGLNAFAGAATFMALEHHERMTPEVRRGYLAPYDSWRNRIATHRFVLDIPMSPAHPSFATLEEIAAGLEKLRGKPLRIAWGERDWCFTPAFREMWQERFPDAEVLRVEHAGHYLLEDAHEEVLPWLDEFLQHPLAEDPTRALGELPERVNIAQFLPEFAALEPERDAVLVARGLGERFRLRGLTYAELEARSNRIARGLHERGLEPGDRVCLFVRPGVDLIAITFALLKAGAVPVLIDPGMGRASLLACVDRMQPRAFIGIPLAHAVRRVFPAAFRTVKLFVTVGRRWLWGGATLDELLAASDAPYLEDTAGGSEAAILFTSGSTGPPKGVTYTHGMFHAQVLALKQLYDFEPGEVDAACFPLFALFSPALRLTCVFPELNPSKPARCDPARIALAIRRSNATSTFGSPAIWRRVVPWCLENDVKLPSLKRVLIAGAPVPPHLVEGFRRILSDGADVHTPYGATESLPVSSISGREILGPARSKAESGSGNCIGRPAPGIDLRLIPITDEAVEQWSDELEVARGELGEITVRGPVVTAEYKFQEEPTRRAKIHGEDGVRHRMGDIGYQDEDGVLWFCGRKAHRLQTKDGLLMPVPIENLFNPHPDVHRTALVGVGASGAERPVLVVEAAPGKHPWGERAREAFRRSLREGVAHQPLAKLVEEILFHPAFPVDVRHNAKIHREELKRWAEGALS